MRDVNIFATQDEAMNHYKEMCSKHADVEIGSIDRTWEGVKLELYIYD